MTKRKIDVNPWRPMNDPAALKHLGKLGEEAGELCSAATRCIIQGIDESEPVTGKPNREWLEDEIADVIANANLTIELFGLDEDRIMRRISDKMARLMVWHQMAA